MLKPPEERILEELKNIERTLEQLKGRLLEEERSHEYDWLGGVGLVLGMIVGTVVMYLIIKYRI